MVVVAVAISVSIVVRALILVFEATFIVAVQVLVVVPVREEAVVFVFIGENFFYAQLDLFAYDGLENVGFIVGDGLPIGDLDCVYGTRLSSYREDDESDQVFCVDFFVGWNGGDSDGPDAVLEDSGASHLPCHFSAYTADFFEDRSGGGARGDEDVVGEVANLGGRFWWYGEEGC